MHDSLAFLQEVPGNELGLFYIHFTSRPPFHLSAYKRRFMVWQIAFFLFPPIIRSAISTILIEMSFGQVLFAATI